MGNSKIYGGFLGVPNPKPDVNTNADIVNVYKFCGSVETVGGLPFCIDFVPAGNPTLNDVEVGTYDAQNKCIYFNEDMELTGFVVEVPIEKVTLLEGQYVVTSTNDKFMEHYRYEFDYANTMLTIDEESKSCETLYFGHANSETVYKGTPYYLGKLEGMTKHIIEEHPDGFVWFEDSAPSVGDVYNVLKNGMNYAWTGTEWDALGGEHKDLEAREQIGDIETALDSIIAIQNSLIGGDGV